MVYINKYDDESWYKLYILGSYIFDCYRDLNADTHSIVENDEMKMMLGWLVMMQFNPELNE